MIWRLPLSLLLCAAPAFANPLEAMWCGERSRMFIDAYGIGFNEHTICDVDNMPVTMVGSSDNTWSSTVACRNVYVVDIEGNGVEEIVERPIDGLTQFVLKSAADGTLILSTDFHETDRKFFPCDR